MLFVAGRVLHYLGCFSQEAGKRGRSTLVASEVKGQTQGGFQVVVDAPDTQNMPHISP